MHGLSVPIKSNVVHALRVTTAGARSVHRKRSMWWTMRPLSPRVTSGSNPMICRGPGGSFAVKHAMATVFTPGCCGFPVLL